MTPDFVLPCRTAEEGLSTKLSSVSEDQLRRDLHEVHSLLGVFRMCFVSRTPPLCLSGDSLMMIVPMVVHFAYLPKRGVGASSSGFAFFMKEWPFTFVYCEMPSKAAILLDSGEGYWVNYSLQWNHQNHHSEQ